MTTEINLRLYAEAIEYVRKQVAAEAPELVQMNVLCDRSTLELRQRLAEELGWTHRKVTEVAMAVLEMILSEVQEPSS